MEKNKPKPFTLQLGVSGSSSSKQEPAGLPRPRGYPGSCVCPRSGPLNGLQCPCLLTAMFTCKNSLSFPTECSFYFHLPLGPVKIPISFFLSHNLPYVALWVPFPAWPLFSCCPLSLKPAFTLPSALSPASSPLPLPLRKGLFPSP